VGPLRWRNRTAKILKLDLAIEITWGLSQIELTSSSYECLLRLSWCFVVFRDRFTSILLVSVDSQLTEHVFHWFLKRFGRCGKRREGKLLVEQREVDSITVCSRLYRLDRVLDVVLTFGVTV